MDLPAALQQLGFSDYEARAYIALVGHEALNGYELAKAAKVPRPNIYGVVDKLLARGAVVRLDRPGGTSYGAVPPRDLFARLRGDYDKLAESVTESLESLASSAERPFVWNVEGYEAVLSHARTAIGNARKTLIVALWPAEAAQLAPDIAHAESSGVDITTLCLAACDTECGGCRGKLYRYRVPASGHPRSLIALADDREVVAGEIGDTGATAVRTAQRLIVELAANAIRNAVALASVVRDLGSQLHRLVTSETGAMLVALGPAATDMVFPTPTSPTDGSSE